MSAYKCQKENVFFFKLFVNFSVFLKLSTNINPTNILMFLRVQESFCQELFLNWYTKLKLLDLKLLSIVKKPVFSKRQMVDHPVSYYFCSATRGGQTLL